MASIAVGKLHHRKQQYYLEVSKNVQSLYFWMESSIKVIGYICSKPLIPYLKNNLITFFISHNNNATPSSFHSMLNWERPKTVFFVRFDKTDRYFRSYHGRKPRTTAKSWEPTFFADAALKYQVGEKVISENFQTSLLFKKSIDAGVWPT